MPASQEGVNGTIFRRPRPDQTSAFFLNVAIHNHPKRRSKAERDLFQGGIEPKPPERLVPAWIQVWSVGKRLVSGLARSRLRAALSTPTPQPKKASSRHAGRGDGLVTREPASSPQGVTPLMDAIR